MRTLAQVATEREALRSSIAELDAVDVTTLEDDAATEHVTRYDEALASWDAIDKEHGDLVSRAQATQAVRDAAATPAALIEDGDDRSNSDAQRNSGGAGRRQSDPWENLDAVRTGLLDAGTMSGRAQDAIERLGDRFQHDSAERAVRLIENDPAVARHILLTSSPMYHEAFRHLIMAKGEIGFLEPDHQSAIRTALSLTGANGGFMVPVTLDPSIILTNSGSANPFRQISTVKTITTNFWEGVTSAGVNAAWLAEAAVAADASPTVAQPVITPAKAAAWVFGSYEVLSDTDFATELPGLLTDAKDRLEEAAFATGTGTNQPKGIITAATTTVTSATANVYAVADVYNTQQAVPARFRVGGRVKAVANVAIINKTRQFDTAGGSSFWANLGQGQPEQLLGSSIYESTTMSALTTTGAKPLIFGDFSQFYIVDRVGMTVMYEPMVKDQATARPTGQAGWFAYWRTGSDAVVPGAFRVLAIA